MPYLSFFTANVESIENYTFRVIFTSYMSQTSQERLSGWKKSACGSQEDLTKLILDSGEWLDEVDETFLRQLQHVSEAFHQIDETLLEHVAIVSKTFHPLYPAIYRCLE